MMENYVKIIVSYIASANLCGHKIINNPSYNYVFWWFLVPETTLHTFPPSIMCSE